jgi:hypothetical protein
MPCVGSSIVDGSDIERLVTGELAEMPKGDLRESHEVTGHGAGVNMSMLMVAL